MYNIGVVKDAPDSWAAVFTDSGKYKGKVTAYDSPIYIADAALYLSKTKPELGIKNPYALTAAQLDAAADLLKAQRENISEYWSDYTKEVQAFESGTSVIGTTWQVIANTIGSDNKVQVNTILPKEGATGWSDTWMVAAKAAHPNCMYKWMNWITSPPRSTPRSPSTSARRRRRPRPASTPARRTSATSSTPPTRNTLSRSTIGRRRSASASTAAETTARPTISGSTNGSRSRGDRTPRSAGTAAGATAGLADHRVSGITCRSPCFGVLEH